jgi:hypothetical protein
MTPPAVLLAAIFCLGLAAPGTAADQPLTLLPENFAAGERWSIIGHLV